jgi:hypothetical protein
MFFTLPFLQSCALFLNEIFCSLDGMTQNVMTLKFDVDILSQLEGEAKRLVKDDPLLSQMLIIEFATRPYDVQSIVKLCNLMCDFFAPLLVKNGMDLPVKLLMLRHEEILTPQLQTYEDKEAKVRRSLLKNIN